MIDADSKMNTIMGRYMFEIVENCAQTVSNSIPTTRNYV